MKIISYKSALLLIWCVLCIFMSLSSLPTPNMPKTVPTQQTPIPTNPVVHLPTPIHQIDPAGRAIAAFHLDYSNSSAYYITPQFSYTVTNIPKPTEVTLRQFTWNLVITKEVARNNVVPKQPINNLPYRYPIQPLSAREKDILAEVVAGRSNKQIAYKLKIALKTVEAHISRISKKLRVPTRVGIAVFAVKAHLVNIEYEDIQTVAEENW